MTDHAAKRVAELREVGIDVSRHLFESGRCAVAHASLQGEIVDPDIPEDRRRLSSDLIIMEELARIYIRDELKLPDSRSLYRSRDRLAPWSPMISAETLEALKAGETPDNAAGLGGQQVSVGIWPDGPISGLERMTTHVDAIENGVVKIVLINERKTVLLVFFLDYRSGRVHTNLEDGGLLYGGSSPDETDVRDYATFFYKVLGNGIAELTCSNIEPIDCEVVIPMNIIPPNPDDAIAAAIEKFRKDNAPHDAP